MVVDVGHMSSEELGIERVGRKKADGVKAKKKVQAAKQAGLIDVIDYGHMGREECGLP